MTHMATDILLAILVIEDDGGVARMPWFSMRSAGSGTAGGEALSILEQQVSDPAVQELQLPSGEGGAVLDWLRQVNERTRSSPVWLVTCAPDAEETTALDGSPGSHFLARPFDPWDLVAVLENLLLTRDGPY
jgi:response regulator RpfG family c-di-GMP phosphodiesterase